MVYETRMVWGRERCGNVEMIIRVFKYLSCGEILLHP